MYLTGKKILWLVDFTTTEVPAGGAEITDSYVIQAGRTLGLDITIVRPASLRSDILFNADLVILSNCYDFPTPALQRVQETKPYVVYLHDSGRWLSVVKNIPDLLIRSKVSIFLSPLHRDCFKTFLGIDDNILLIPPHIPPNFYDAGEDRDNKILFVGNIHDGKGVKSIIEYAKNNQQTHIDFYFNRSQGPLLSQLKGLSNCNLVGFVPKEVIFNNYNKYAYFIHIPQHFEAFGRSVAEAFLCGCKLIVNERVGALSYGWDYATFRQKTLNSHFDFWKKLENCVF